MFAFGDSVQLNDALYENYLSMTRYEDFDLEKTASFADLMSLNQTQEAYIGRTQDYSLRGFSYLPSAGFKARSRELNKFKEKFAYPKVHRQANYETKRNQEIFESLLDVKAKKTKNFRKVYSGGQDEEQRDSSDRAAGERVQDSQHL